jgi:nucleoside triphosphate diphosphatase
VEHTQADPRPTAAQPEALLDRALALVEFLRRHCPWDAAQTPESLRRYLLEETHEVLHAITGADDAGLCGELGDLLHNLAFQVVLAEERGAFGRADVIAALEGKMRRRHPHLYGDGDAEPWEQIKARERGTGRSLLADVPRGLDTLLRAQRIQERVAGVGFDWPDPRGAIDKVAEELEEVRMEIAGDDTTATGRAALEAEVGDLLFAVVNVARLAGVDAHAALAGANHKFERRFGKLEALARVRDVPLGSTPLAELDRLWDEVKAAERGTDG